MRITILLFLSIFADFHGGFFLESAVADGCSAPDSDGYVHCSATLSNDPIDNRTGPTGVCSKDVKANFRWFNSDAPNNAHTAKVRGIVIRKANTGNIDDVRTAYAEGQKHRPDIASLILDCTDDQVRTIAYQVAEEARIQSCGTPPPARSASCSDVYENIRWSLMDAGVCRAYAQDYIFEGIVRAEVNSIEGAQLIRRGLKAAEGHRQEIFDSVDYVSDALVIGIAKKVIAVHDIDSRLLKTPSKLLPGQCPGLDKLDE